MQTDFGRGEYGNYAVEVSRSRLRHPSTWPEDLAHEVLHILLWPYTRLATDIAGPLAPELERREEEIVTQLAECLAPLLRLALDWPPAE